MAVLNTTQQSGVLVGYIFSFEPGHSFPQAKRVINRQSCVLASMASFIFTVLTSLLPLPAQPCYTGRGR